MKKTILLLMIVLVVNTTYAHRDMIFCNTFGNVETSITTGYNYEDINKVIITGKLIKLLSDDLKYNSKISLYIHHTYTSPDFKTKYCLSYESNKIQIRVYCYRVTPLDLIKLAEYAILNKSDLKRLQEEETFDVPYHKQTIFSVGDSVITSILEKSTSNIVAQVLNNKIYRPQKDGEHSSSKYYFQNNKYYITGQEYNKNTCRFEDVVLAEYDDIFQFSAIKSENILLFDTDSSFVFYDSFAQPFNPKEKISKRHTFNKLNAWANPYEISCMGRDRICIVLYYLPKKRFKKYFDEPEAAGLSTGRKNNMIYLVDNDFLIEDADDILDSVAIQRLQQQ